MTTLVVAAHPDDEVLGCGGTIAKRTAAGEAVHMLILGEGATSRFADGQAASETTELVKAGRRAADILGVTGIEHVGLPDNQFDTVSMLSIVRPIEDAIERLAPTSVLCQHGGDLNVDHQRTFQAVLTATRSLPGQTVGEVLAFEVVSSTEWAFQRFAPVFRPSVFEDISLTLDHKLRALDAYASEMRPFPHPRSVRGVEALATRWGTVVGVAAAEAFELVRLVR